MGGDGLTFKDLVGIYWHSLAFCCYPLTVPCVIIWMIFNKKYKDNSPNSDVQISKLSCIGLLLLWCCSLPFIIPGFIYSTNYKECIDSNGITHSQLPTWSLVSCILMLSIPFLLVAPCCVVWCAGGGLIIGLGLEALNLLFQPCWMIYGIVLLATEPGMACKDSANSLWIWNIIVIALSGIGIITCSIRAGFSLN